MFLTKYRPNNTLDSFFGDVLPFFGAVEEGQEEASRLPVTNVNETDAEYVLTMEMPGVEKKNVDVAIESDHIVITGEKTEKAEAKGLLRREIRSEKFRRSFLLDASIEREGITAKLNHGVLKVSLPKKTESVGRKINID